MIWMTSAHEDDALQEMADLIHIKRRNERDVVMREDAYFLAEHPLFMKL